MLSAAKPVYPLPLQCSTHAHTRLAGIQLRRRQSWPSRTIKNLKNWSHRRRRPYQSTNVAITYEPVAGRRRHRKARVTRCNIIIVLFWNYSLLLYNGEERNEHVHLCHKTNYNSRRKRFYHENDYTYIGTTAAVTFFHFKCYWHNIDFKILFCK